MDSLVYRVGSHGDFMALAMIYFSCSLYEYKCCSILVVALPSHGYMSRYWFIYCMSEPDEDVFDIAVKDEDVREVKLAYSHQCMNDFRNKGSYNGLTPSLKQCRRVRKYTIFACLKTRDNIRS